MARNMGRPRIYGEPMMQIHALIPMSLYEKLDTLWRRNSRSRNEIVRSALAEYLNWTPKAETQK